jgi:uncharacterized protein with GYD domain
MPTYLVLLKLTEQGRRDIGDLSGLDRAKQAVQAAGGQWKGWYLTLGRYDGVAIIEAPDDETVAKLALAQGRGAGAVSETLRAFTEDEFRQFVAALPPAPASP